MQSNQEIYDFILNNIRKIIMPEELIGIDDSVSRFELFALLLIQRQQNMTMSNLAAGMAVPMSTATGIIERLVKKGFLTRGSDAADRRVVTVSLTNDGQTLVEKLDNQRNAFINRVRNIVTEEEFAFMLRIMRKVIIGLQNDKAELSAKPAQSRQSILIE